jgi:hypothetical protein
MWFTLHIPIVSALTIVGDATGVLVRENIDVATGIRWIFCGGYSVAMFFIWALAMLEFEEDLPNELWFPRVRFHMLAYQADSNSMAT